MRPLLTLELDVLSSFEFAPHADGPREATFHVWHMKVLLYAVFKVQEK